MITPNSVTVKLDWVCNKLYRNLTKQCRPWLGIDARNDSMRVPSLYGLNNLIQ